MAGTGVVTTEAEFSVVLSRVAGHKALAAHRLDAGELSNVLRTILVPRRKWVSFKMGQAFLGF